jgi:DNA-directed RNA polymerase subunit RPC12/RpoP
MIIKGELSCMSCGRYLGEVSGDPTRPVDRSWLVPGSAPTEPRFTERGIKCSRCGGKALMERTERVYQAA